MTRETEKNYVHQWYTTKRRKRIGKKLWTITLITWQLFIILPEKSFLKIIMILWLCKVSSPQKKRDKKIWKMNFFSCLKIDENNKKKWWMTTRKNDWLIMKIILRILWNLIDWFFDFCLIFYFLRSRWCIIDGGICGPYDDDGGPYGDGGNDGGPP